MKLRITEPGWETYEGQFGVIWFAKGMSTDDVSPLDAVRIAAVIKAEWEDGRVPSLGGDFGEAQFQTAPIEDTRIGIVSVPKSTNEPTAVAVEPTETPGWTTESLGEIADAKGIAGLREIADPMGVKAKSIQSLINAILKVQAGTPAADVNVE